MIEFTLGVLAIVGIVGILTGMVVMAVGENERTRETVNQHMRNISRKPKVRITNKDLGRNDLDIKVKAKNGEPSLKSLKDLDELIADEQKKLKESPRLVGVGQLKELVRLPAESAAKKPILHIGNPRKKLKPESPFIQPVTAEAALNVDEETEDLSEWIRQVRRKHNVMPEDALDFPQGKAEAFRETEKELAEIREKLKSSQKETGKWVGAYREAEKIAKEKDVLMNALNEEIKQLESDLFVARNSGAKSVQAVRRESSEALTRVRQEAAAKEAKMLRANVALRNKMEDLEQKLREFVAEDADKKEQLLADQDNIVAALDYLATRVYVKGQSEEAMRHLQALGGYYKGEELGFYPHVKPTKAVHDRVRDFLSDMMTDSSIRLHNIGKWYREIV